MRSLCLVATSLLVLSACGKSGGFASVPPDPGLYRLDDGATFLDLGKEGTFTVHRRAAAGIGATECGSWKRDSLSLSGHVVMREGMYWPTPMRYPSTVFQKITLHGEENGELVVVGESEWAGSFTQRWVRGGKSYVPACTPPKG